MQSYMKTRYIQMRRLAPILGLVLVAVGGVGSATYFNLERKIKASEALSAKMDRLCQDHTISAVLKTIQEGDVAGGAQRLDLMLCDDLLQLGSQMESADPERQAYTQRLLARIARLRPNNAVIAAGTTRKLYADQIAAEKLLSVAAARDQAADNTVAASH
jgi:hypothetical protein